MDVIVPSSFDMPHSEGTIMLIDANDEPFCVTPSRPTGIWLFDMPSSSVHEVFFGSIDKAL